MGKHHPDRGQMPAVDCCCLDNQDIYPLKEMTITLKRRRIVDPKPFDEPKKKIDPMECEREKDYLFLFTL